MIYPGAIVEITATFRLTRTGVKVDPGEVTLTLQDPAGNLYSTLTYNSGAGEIEREGLGAYKYDFTVPDSDDSPGEWKYKFAGTSPAVGVTHGRFKVREPLETASV